MSFVNCKVTNKKVEILHLGFDIAIIVRNDKQECVNVNTLDVQKRPRPKYMMRYE
jgi:hypothetical protein